MTWVIVGLGNPGEEYRSTRHNAGRMAIEHFAAIHDLGALSEDKKNQVSVARSVIGGAVVVFLAPNTFMNKSGSAVQKFIKSAKAAERLVVVYDDLDLPLGTMKISFDRGSGGHKGLESVIRAVKTKKFTRVRIGTSPTNAAGAVKKPAGERAVQTFILQPFATAEMVLLRRIFKRVGAALEAIVGKGYVQAMNEFN